MNFISLFSSMPPVKKVGDQPNLVETSKYPSYAHFPFEKFNPVQSRVFEFFQEDCNAVIAAKTSAGKTIIAEILAAHQLRKVGGKVIYLAPMKALAKEKTDDWTDTKHHFGDLKIAICTGDFQLTDQRKKELEAADIIVMTSEMLNARCRNMKSEKSEFLKQVTLCISDESHLLAVPGRGDHLEVGLMNLAKISPNVRFCLLSATMPNVSEIAEWVSYSLTGKETYLLESEYRPCPLGVHYETYSSYGSYDDQEDEKINTTLKIIDDHPTDRFLLFVHTKRTGEKLLKTLKRNGYEAEFHKGDLDKDKRHALEKRFRDGKLQYLISTSTLAWGCYSRNSLICMKDGILPISEVKVNDYVLSYNGTAFVPAKVLQVGKKLFSKSFKFTLESGEEIHVSESHEFYGAIGRKKPDYYSAHEFKVKDFIAIPSKFNVFDNVEASDLGYLIGYVMGDGCKSKAGKHADGTDKIVLDIAFGNDEKKHVKYIRELFNKEFDYSFGKTRMDADGVLHLVAKKRELLDNFCFLPTGRNKDKLSLSKLPRKDAAYLKGVIQALFDSDGGFSKHTDKHTSLEFTTISKQLANEIHQILLYFGIRSATGKKKMKDVVINGRLQVARRKYSYRVRIYQSQISNFLDKIGFRNVCKNSYGQYFTNNKSLSNEKDLLPCRTLIETHAEVNEISSYKMMDNIKADKWSVLNRQELTRKKCINLINAYPNNSELKKLTEGEIRFSRIKKIEKINKPIEMWDIEVEKYHNFVGSGVVSHNCNLPARRVVIVGVHRGMSPVDTWDIFQMIGRSGRPGYDDRGDAYILVPDTKADEHINRLKTQQPIMSRLLDNVGDHYKTLAFHVVSEIHHGGIKTKADVKNWYKKTLAHFQSKHLDDKIVNSTIDLLIKCGAIKEEEGKLKVTVVGMVSSMFYYSPFDAADLRRNFMWLFKEGLHTSDLHVALALGNVDSNRMGIVSRAEREDFGDFMAQVWKKFGRDTFTEPAIKGAFLYYSAMTGNDAGALASLVRNVQFYYPRQNQVLMTLDSMGCKWNKKSYFNEMQSRIVYGVRSELLPLIKLPEVGKVRAENLWNAGIKSPQDLLAKQELAKKTLNLKAEKFLEIINAANVMVMVGD